MHIEQQQALMTSIGTEGRILREENDRGGDNTLEQYLLRSCQVQLDISR
jgi:hypothetical protein